MKYLSLGSLTDEFREMTGHTLDQYYDLASVSFYTVAEMTGAWSPRVTSLTSTAQSQLCGFLGIPRPYLLKCPAELQDTNIGYWQTVNRNRNCLFRLIQSDNNDYVCRAILSDRYKILNTISILDMLTIYAANEMCYVSYDADFFHLHVPCTSKNFRINGNVFAPGISVINSETGQRRFEVNTMLVLKSASELGEQFIDTPLVLGKNVNGRIRHSSTRICHYASVTIDAAWNELSSEAVQERITRFEQRAISFTQYETLVNHVARIGGLDEEQKTVLEADVSFLSPQNMLEFFFSIAYAGRERELSPFQAEEMRELAGSLFMA